MEFNSIDSSITEAQPLNHANGKPKLATAIRKVTDYDIFQFETVMREIIDRQLTPILNAAEIDRVRVIKANQVLNDVQRRVIELE